VAGLDKKSSNPTNWDREDLNIVDTNPRSKYAPFLDDFYSNTSPTRKQREECECADSEEEREM